MAKLHAITSGTISIGADMEVSSGTLKFTQQNEEYTPMSATSPAFRVVVPGGTIGCEGSVSFAWDSTISGAGTFPAPFSTSLVACVFTIGAKTVSFNAAIDNLEITKGDKLVECKCDYKSSGTVTFA